MQSPALFLATDGDSTSRSGSSDVVAFGTRRAPSFVAQETKFKQLNALVAKTSPPPATKALIDGLFPANAAYDPTYVPAGWNATESDRVVYKDVIGPYCRGCHASFSNANDPLALDSAVQLETFAALIQTRMCGVGPEGMPVAEQTILGFYNSKARAVLLPWAGAAGACAPNGIAAPELRVRSPHWRETAFSWHVLSLTQLVRIVRLGRMNYVRVGMNMKIALWVGLAMTASFVAPAFADDVDVQAFEYVDVIEKTDGSIIKGVIVEQVPGQKYKLATSDGSVFVIAANDVVKLTKEKNKNYRGDNHYVPQNGGSPRAADGMGVSSGSSLPPPVVSSGTRIDFEADVLVPQGDISKLDTSFAPTFRVAHEELFGNFGLSGGGMARWTYWMLPGDSGDAMWTLETHAFARATLHAGKLMPYVGLSLGTDTNYVYVKAADMSQTNVGLGTNLTFGVAIAASPTLAVDIGGDFHPGTDKIVDGSDTSISYFALRLGLRML